MKIIKTFAKLLLVSSLLVVPAKSAVFVADSKIAVNSQIIPNNTNIINVKTSGGTVYSIDGFNNGTTLAYIKFFNKADAVCGTDTPYARYLIPYGASSSGGGFNISNINGDAYRQGISYCVTTGIADSDTGAPAASTYIVNVHYQ